MIEETISDQSDQHQQVMSNSMPQFRFVHQQISMPFFFYLDNTFLLHKNTHQQHQSSFIQVNCSHTSKIKLLNCFFSLKRHFHCQMIQL